jgi:hypothetical protein
MDSYCAKKGITEWIHTWKRNGFRNSKKRLVVNGSLWKELDETVARYADVRSMNMVGSCPMNVRACETPKDFTVGLMNRRSSQGYRRTRIAQSRSSQMTN